MLNWKKQPVLLVPSHGGGFVSSVTKRAIFSVFALAEPIVARFFHRKTNRLESEPQMDVFVGAIADRVGFWVTTKAPAVNFACFQADSEGFFVVDFSISWLQMAINDSLLGQNIFRDFGKATSLKMRGLWRILRFGGLFFVSLTCGLLGWE